jgi:hypothetical protein
VYKRHRAPIIVRCTASAHPRETTSRAGNNYTTFKLEDQSGSCAVNIFIWGHLLYPITITFAWMVYSRLNIIRVTTRSITRSKGRKSLLFLSKQSGERGFRCVTLDELAQDRSGSGSWPDILWPDMVSFGSNRNQAVCVRSIFI